MEASTIQHGTGPQGGLKAPKAQVGGPGVQPVQTACPGCGPGVSAVPAAVPGAALATYGSVQAARAAPVEKLMYVACLGRAWATDGASPDVGLDVDERQEDFLAVVCLDPDSPDYCKIVHRAYTIGPKEELHHFGWNACASCHGRGPAGTEAGRGFGTSVLDVQQTGHVAGQQTLVGASRIQGPTQLETMRRYLIVPAMRSGNIYILDCVPDPSHPRLVQVIAGEDMASRLDLTTPHTVHCIPTGQVMISELGDAQGRAPGGFLLLEPSGQSVEPSTSFDTAGGKGAAGLLGQPGPFTIAGRWEASPSDCAGLLQAGMSFNYDYWYQPRLGVMLSSEWAAPKGACGFFNGFNPQCAADGQYGSALHVWDWNSRTLVQNLPLPQPQGAIPLEVRFLHDPGQAHAFVGVALGSTLVHVHKTTVDTAGINQGQLPAAVASGAPDLGAGRGPWLADIVESIGQEVHGLPSWPFPMPVPALITDIVVSLDDQWLYCSCWLHGDVRQYDISDPAHPRLAGRYYLGGVGRRFGPGPLDGRLQDGVKHAGTAEPQISDSGHPVFSSGVQSVRLGGQDVALAGGPQMLQLSLDGKRLYVTSSIFSSWDDQFYPDLKTKGSNVIRLNCHSSTHPESGLAGGLSVDTGFLVQLQSSTGSPVRAHEMRFPGGDSTSDVWI